MRLTKFTLASSFIALTATIVVPGGGSVNRADPTLDSPKLQIADGMALPPPPPPRATAEVTVMADGMPLPPPPKGNEVVSAVAYDGFNP